MMKDRKYNILILCTGNSARSILGEALVNRLGSGRFKGFSAGSTPAGKVNPFAISLLKDKGFEVDGFRSKSWDEFTGPDAPKMDFVFTVCDNAAGEVCPVWHGTPLQAHWGIPDPAAIKGSDEEIMAAFTHGYQQLKTRIQAFTRIDLENTPTEQLKSQLAAIGRIGDDG